MRNIAFIAALIFLGGCLYYTPDKSTLPIVLGVVSALAYARYLHVKAD
ncbi:hypothetical protein [Corynebacterium hindlerae]